jgi:hypothetical protein
VVAGLIVLVAVVAPVLHVLAHRPGAFAGRHGLVRVLDGLGPLRAATGGAAAAAAAGLR